MRLFLPVVPTASPTLDFSDSDAIFYYFADPSLADTKGIQATLDATSSGPQKLHKKEQKSKEKELKAQEKEQRRELKNREKELKAQEKERDRKEKELRKSQSKDIKVRSSSSASASSSGNLPPIDLLESLVELIIAPDTILLQAIAKDVPAAEVDLVSKVLLHIFSVRDMASILTETVIQSEINNTNHVGTLFRANTLASKILTAYSRQVGTPYLKATLTPFLQAFSVTGTEYEVDPSKLPPDTDPLPNMERLLSITSQLFDSFISSIDQFPASLRSLCNYLYLNSESKFENSGHFAVGGFFFLRFIGPVLVSPEAFGLVPLDFVSPPLRRTLILVSKILQTLANGIEFGSKEEYMISANTFITQRRPDLSTLIGLLSQELVVPSFLTDCFSSDSSQPSLDFDLIFKLAKYLHSSHSRLLPTLQSLISSSTVCVIGKQNTLIPVFDSTLASIFPP